ncbi:sn-glycerol-3-phosphate ABC transporter ATP-binding protein UgpC [Candidatus Bariatricus faecipullorum]
MSFIEFKNVCKKYPGSDKNTVENLNLEIEEKEFIAFVGPSGCGKSTTLRMVAGFEEITGGELYIDGKKVNEVAPRDRGIAMVFQNYALYPHMTVEKNIGYGLKNMKLPADEIKKKVDWAIQILGLEEYRYRKPKNLSGGQRQRVALGRAIVKNQKVFLMDEPLSNLDAKLRVSMRTEISKLHRELGATTIYVTHDQVEAMTMADRIVIMKEGVIQQVGKPMELYDHPKNQFVAGFIGSPQMNFFDVTVENGTVHFSDGNMLALSEATIKKLNGHQGEMILGIRGEDLKVDAQNMELNKDSHQHAVITDTEVMGNENNLYFEFGGSQAVARVSKYEISQVGDRIDFVFMPSKLHFFDKETGVNYTEEV